MQYLNGTRLFFVVTPTITSDEWNNEELFETLIEARNCAKHFAHLEPRIFISAVNYAYKDNGVWTYEDTADTFELIKEIPVDPDSESNIYPPPSMTNAKTLYGNFPKTKDHGLNRDAYLLGTDADGTKYWLQAPSWDCGWYWGFGYIQSYERNRKPSAARDIDCHQHATKFFPDWVHGDDAILTATTFSEKEGWLLAELFKQFYILRESAELFGCGSSNITTTTDGVQKDAELAKRINEIEIPRVTTAILAILSPEV